MPGPGAITRLNEITPEWMTAFVRDLGHDVRVEAVDSEPIGTGQSAHSERFTLTYASPAPDAPTSFVGKFPSPDPTSRRTGSMGSYVREVSFYRQIRPTVDIRTPVVHRIEFDEASADFMLMMEDMAPATQGDQMAGCTVAEAEAAMDEIARLHAPRWGDPTLMDYPFFSNIQRGAMERAFYRRLWRGFLSRYESLLAPDLLDLGRSLEERFNTYGRLYPGNRTITHGDYRLDNLLIGRDGPTPVITVVDWQTVGIGCGALDVAYFIGAGLLPEVRRKHERDLVRRYHEALQAGGVRDYSFDQLWEDYRWYAYAGYVMAVVATTLVVQTERGDEMFLTMARRHGQHAIDLESEKLLDAAGSD